MQLYIFTFRNGQQQLTRLEDSDIKTILRLVKLSRKWSENRALYYDQPADIEIPDLIFFDRLGAIIDCAEVIACDVYIASPKEE